VGRRVVDRYTTTTGSTSNTSTVVSKTTAFHWSEVVPSCVVHSYLHSAVFTESIPKCEKFPIKPTRGHSICKPHFHAATMSFATSAGALPHRAPTTYRLQLPNIASTNSQTSTQWQPHKRTHKSWRRQRRSTMCPRARSTRR
jgi:hypothetical protein